MKAVYKLYILFVLLFVIGDLASTQVVIHREDTAEPDEILPEKCRVTVPAECDSSPIIREAGSAIAFTPIMGKLIIGIIVGILVLYIPSALFYPLLAINVFSSLIVSSNLAISFWKYAWIFPGISIFFTMYMLQYFTKRKEE